MSNKDVYIFSRIQGAVDRVLIAAWEECALAYPIAKKFKDKGCRVEVVLGFESGDSVAMEDEFAEISDRFIVYTSDGSRGERNDMDGAVGELLREGDLPGSIYIICPSEMRGRVECLLRR